MDNNHTTASTALMRQRILLEAEYNCEKEVFRNQIMAIGLRRNVKRGYAWFPLRVARSFYNSLNRLAVEVFRTADTDTEHNFEFGRQVCFFKVEETRGSDGKSEEKISYFNFTGNVSYTDGDRMVVTVPDNAPVAELQAAVRAGVQLSFDETGYRLMFEALDRTMRAKDNRLAYLRDLFYSRRPAETYTFGPVHLPWLNETQEQAVNSVLAAKDVSIVHGPPGTGKTTTLVEAIHETLYRESQVLVCAQSNMAVDWISERLVDRGINVLRIGNPARVNDKMLSFTYERRFEDHPDYPQLWTIRKAIRQLRQSRGKGHDSRWHQKVERLKSRAVELEIRINSQLFGEARVIASTLTGSASQLMSGMKFSTLFIDEAAQALEAACWIAIRRASRVILAGDHCQLPPTIKSIAALKGGLGVTLMERIASLKPEAVTLLKMQYRMNERIMRFSSDWFYGGYVEPAPQVRFRGILDYDNPMEWIDTSKAGSHEEFIGDSFGRINKAEAALTIGVLKDYLAKIGRGRVLEEHIDIGIISPYRVQVQYLRSLIGKNDFFRPFRHYISVNTVDGFQGQERDIILISLVRSNDDGQIGFLSDLRRMNVAITRARMKLIILVTYAPCHAIRFIRSYTSMCAPDMCLKTWTNRNAATVYIANDTARHDDR